MENVLVSVIVPIYNTEKYLERCVESVIQQSWPNLEIILVDDGSFDQSCQMCDDFVKKDSRIKVLHKKNGGLSSARNEGMKIAQGDYIVFLDSDDYLAVDYVEKSLNICKKTSADIVIMQMCYIAEDTNNEIKNQEQERIQVFSAEKAIEASLYQVLYSCCAPGKLYRKEVLEGIHFPIGKLSEDLAVCHLILHNAKKVAYSNSFGYYYRQHSGSIMHVFNPKRLDALEWAEQIEEFCRKEYPDILNAARCRTFNVSVHLILDLPDSGKIHDEYYNRIWAEVKRTRKYIIFCKKVRFREKAAAVLSFGGEKLLKKVWNSGLSVKQEEK